MFAHSNFKRCMVISGVIILAHAALSRMGLLAHRSPRAQQPWQMPTSLCDGLKRRCSHELPAARPFGASPTPSPANPVARRSGRHACLPVRPSVSHQSGRSSVTKSGRLPARRSVSPAVRQSGCPPARQSGCPPARPARVLASLAVLRSDHPPTCPTRRPSVGPAVRRSSHPIARQPGISPTWPPTCPPVHSSKRVRNFDRWAIGDGLRASPFASLRPSGRRRAPAAMGAGLHRAHVPLSSAPHANPGRWRA